MPRLWGSQTRFQQICLLLAALGVGGLSTGCASSKNQVAKSDTDSGDDDDENDDEDDADVADTDKKEETPDSLGDLQVSENRKDEEIQADLLAQKTFPLVYNEFVDQWVRYFTQNRGTSVFTKWLGRSTRYIPMMKQVLRDEGLPEDLIYLAMIESGFLPTAASRAKAVGPWQFIKSTGQRYGLVVNAFIDERRDYRKSTFAAAKYLKELHQIFGSWYLAAASYNAGEGKVLFAVRKDRTRNFWELARKKKNFRSETRNYVPKIIAAALLAKNPEKYGFSGIEYQNPLAWETVKVPGGVDVRAIAKVIGEEVETLQLLNSELRRSITPPDSDGYNFRVPPEKKDLLVANLDKLEVRKGSLFATHTVRRGENLKSIARRYGTDVDTLLELNQIKRKSRVRPGTELAVPLAMHVKAEVAEGGKKKSKKSGAEIASEAAARAPTTLAGAKASVSAAVQAAKEEAAPKPARAQAGGTYTVQKGDSLWAISRKYGVSVETIKKLNNLRGKRDIRAGITLKIPNKDG